ncbi:hypothetical protein Tco_1309482 [Tanacetum coccineum]
MTDSYLLRLMGRRTRVPELRYTCCVIKQSTTGSGEFILKEWVTRDGRERESLALATSTAAHRIEARLSGSIPITHTIDARPAFVLCENWKDGRDCHRLMSVLLFTRNTSGLPQLAPYQVLKLKQVTMLTLAKANKLSGDRTRNNKADGMLPDHIHDCRAKAPSPLIPRRE